MLLLLPVIFLIATAIIILVIYYLKPSFKYFWMFALLGSFLAFVGVFLWKIHFPARASLLPWLPLNLFYFSPTWLADSNSWPYALALSSLGISVILTAIARKESDPLLWIGTLLTTAIGILAVSAGDPLTLILVWSALDISELVVMLRLNVNERQSNKVILLYSFRVIGMGLVIVAYVLDASIQHYLTFESISINAGVFFLAGVALRLAVLPFNWRVEKDNHVRHGLRTTILLVSAASSLAVVARIPSSSLSSPWTPNLLILVAITALFSSWKWWKAPEELSGHPYWILGVGSLAIGSALRGNPEGSAGWGVIMVLSGALLLLYTSRQRKIVWIVLMGAWGISSLPFSPTSSWMDSQAGSWFFLLQFIPSQALLLSGYIRHAILPGENNLAAQEGWIQILYTLGLSILLGITILLGIWGWDGALKVGTWWISILVVVLSIGLFVSSRKLPNRTLRKITHWENVIRIDWLVGILNAFIKFLETIARLVTTTLEGEGGVFWSFLLLVLILSLIATGK